MGRPGLAAVWTGWLLAALVLAEDPVYIPDPALKAAIEDALGRVDPTAMDMLELDELTAPSRCISDLTGLQYATDLQWLDLSRGNDSGGAGIWDIGPLAGLTKLKHLDLNNNYIRDISALSGMDLLEFLDLHDNRVWDLSPLAGKTRLHTAYLYRQWDQTGNLLSDILVLAGLSNLSILHLEENHIRDLGPVVNLMSLTELNVLRNPLDDEACASHIPLILEHNPGIQIVYRPCGPLRLTLSSTAGGAVLTPGEGTFTYSYGQTVPLDARADPGFVFSHWSGTHYSTANPMSVTMDQDHEVRVQFLSLRDVLVVEGAAQGDPGPGDSTVSDPQEDGTPGHPFDSIQEAIDVADHGASVVVRPGTYREMIDLRGKGIRVTGLDPADPCSPYPVIHGNGQGPVVCWSRGEDSPCT
ncbi:MAG: leucine-rich repeat domain-containing protein, partial [Phycisphaerae bacterium]|nr:leucine-rich repeat domain-containing protein [Phycisphaerae bacterium]